MEAGPNDDPDAELLARMGRGEEAAFRALIARKLPRIHALALRLLGSAGEADTIGDLGHRAHGGEVVLGRGEQQNLLLIAGFDGQRERHARKDDHVLERDQK